MAATDPVVLLPIGAVEQHGPHLPVHEDSIVAEWVADQLAQRTGCLVAPALHYGHSPMFRGYPGNLSLSAQTLRTVTYELLESLVHSGFRRIVLIDNNGGNVAPGHRGRHGRPPGPGHPRRPPVPVVVGLRADA